VMLCKPALDVRFEAGAVTSRAGLTYPADLLLYPDTKLDFAAFDGLSCVLVDEAQFVAPTVLDQFRELTRMSNIPVICYGLRTDFRTHLFEGSRRLFELADAIEEVKTTCQFCNRKAVFNLRHDAEGNAIVEGPKISLGSDEQYSPTCYTCYHERVAAAELLAKV